MATQDNDDGIVLEARPDTTHGVYIGNCKWFNSKLGYGFLRICNTELKGTDVFVHHSGLTPLNSSFKTLYKGEYVHFNMTDGRSGKQAMDVTGIFGGPLMCDNVTHRASSSRPFDSPMHMSASAHAPHATGPMPPSAFGGFRPRARLATRLPVVYVQRQPAFI